MSEFRVGDTVLCTSACGVEEFGLVPGVTYHVAAVSVRTSGLEQHIRLSEIPWLHHRDERRYFMFVATRFVRVCDDWDEEGQCDYNTNKTV